MEWRKPALATPDWATLTFMVLEGTSVRSAMRMLNRMTRHMGPTRPFQVYLGMYSGMWVWYETCTAVSRVRIDVQFWHGDLAVGK